MLVAAQLNKPFDRNNAAKTHQKSTTLILVVSAEDQPAISITIFRSGEDAQTSQLSYDRALKSFTIPAELALDAPVVQMVTGQRQLMPYNANNANNASDANIALLSGRFEKCFDCHLVVQNVNDHMPNCGVKWFLSTRADVYAKIPAVRYTITFPTALQFSRNGRLSEADDEELFSPAMDALLKFEANGKKLSVLTTGFSRLRVPILICEGNAMFTEKLVLLTSHDRAVIAAHGSRVVDLRSVLDGFEHNTPLVLCLHGDQKKDFSIDVYSSGGQKDAFELVFKNGRYVIPSALDVKSKQFSPKPFDADLPKKNK